jgi:DNA polymerase-3 subunit delta
MSIAWGKKPKTVLILGNSDFLKEREIQRGIDAHGGYSVLDFDGTSDMDAVERTLMSRSLFSEKRFVVIRSIEGSKSRRKILVDYCANPQDDLTLVMVTSKSRVPKWVTQDLNPEVVEKFEAMKSWQLPDWVVEEAKSRGLTFPKSFAEAIVLNVGEDLYSLTNELDKLQVYCGDRSEVEVSDIEAVLFQHTAFSPFEVVDLWALGERDHSVRMFLAHLDNTPRTEWMKSVLVILGSLQDRVENILKAKDMKARRMPSNDIASKIGVSSYVYLNHLTPQLSARKAVALEDAYLDLAEIEARVKMGAPGKLLLEAFLLTH